MKSAVYPSALALLFCFVPLSLTAQPSPFALNQAPSRTPEDVAWETIRLDAYHVSEPETSQPADEVGRKASAARRASSLVEKANRARDFHQKNSGHAKSGEAKRLEAILLLNALYQGETSIEGRARQAVDAIRSDTNLPEAMRAEVVGTAGFMAAMAKNLKGRDLLADYESTARALILQFPGQPHGYESLATIARDSDETRGIALAQELLNLPSPAPIKEQAKFLLARYQLVGTLLNPILNDAGVEAAITATRKDRPSLIYTWATWSPGSIKLGQDLAKRNLNGVNVLAVNLDENVAAAQALAAQSGLSGTLLYDARGTGGALARGLKLNAAPQVYFVDAEGIVRDVRGTDHLQEKLTQRGL